MKIVITCVKCKQDRLVNTRGMLKVSYEKKHPKCHKCGFNKEKSSRTWFNKGHIPWTKGLKAENHPSWKGDRVGYWGLHNWIEREQGKPKKCEDCGKTKGKFVWANLSHKYLRDLSDWKRLCSVCHFEYDRLNGWGEATRQFPYINP